MSTDEETDMDRGIRREDERQYSFKQKTFMKRVKSTDLKTMRKETAEWISEVTGQPISPADVLSELKSGIVLLQCAKSLHLIKHQHDLHTNSAAQEELQLLTPEDPHTLPEEEEMSDNPQVVTRWRANIAKFLTWCRSIGVREITMFESDDLVMERKEYQVLNCILKMSGLFARFGVEPPESVKEEIEAISRRKDAIESESSPAPEATFAASANNDNNEPPAVESEISKTELATLELHPVNQATSDERELTSSPLYFDTDVTNEKELVSKAGDPEAASRLPEGNGFIEHIVARDDFESLGDSGSDAHSYKGDFSSTKFDQNSGENSNSTYQRYDDVNLDNFDPGLPEQNSIPVFSATNQNTSEYNPVDINVTKPNAAQKSSTESKVASVGTTSVDGYQNLGPSQVTNGNEDHSATTNQNDPELKEANENAVYLSIANESPEGSEISNQHFGTELVQFGSEDNQRLNNSYPLSDENSSVRVSTNEKAEFQIISSNQRADDSAKKNRKDDSDHNNKEEEEEEEENDAELSTSDHDELADHGSIRIDQNGDLYTLPNHQFKKISERENKNGVVNEAFSHEILEHTGTDGKVAIVIDQRQRETVDSFNFSSSDQAVVEDIEDAASPSKSLDLDRKRSSETVQFQTADTLSRQSKDSNQETVSRKLISNAHIAIAIVTALIVLTAVIVLSVLLG